MQPKKRPSRLHMHMMTSTRDNEHPRLFQSYTNPPSGSLFVHFHYLINRRVFNLNKKTFYLRVRIPFNPGGGGGSFLEEPETFRCISGDIKRFVSSKGKRFKSCNCAMGHFRVHVCLLFKASPGAKFFL